MIQRQPARCLALSLPSSEQQPWFLSGPGISFPLRDLMESRQQGRGCSALHGPGGAEGRPGGAEGRPSLVLVVRGDFLWGSPGFPASDSVVCVPGPSCCTCPPTPGRALLGHARPAPAASGAGWSWGSERGAFNLGAPHPCWDESRLELWLGGLSSTSPATLGVQALRCQTYRIKARAVVFYQPWAGVA